MYFVIFNLINYNFIVGGRVLISLGGLFFIVGSGVSGGIGIFIGGLRCLRVGKWGGFK